MPEYKLTYFNIKGRGELIRLLFHTGGIKFIDTRVDSKEWPELKPKIPHGALPVLEIDGKMYGQSIAIARYVAKQAGLLGKTPIEELTADEIVDTTVDFGHVFAAARFEEDEAKKAPLMKALESDTIPKYLEIFSRLLKINGGNFYVGKSLTWADVSIFYILDIIARDPAVLAKFPELAAFKKRMEDNPSITAYLKVRPHTDV